MAGRLDGRELRIDVRSDDSLLFGRFDFAQTLRALVNLIENAAKYSPPGEHDRSSGRTENRHWLVFSVADRGPGVPVGERDRIFEPFYRRAGRSRRMSAAQDSDCRSRAESPRRRAAACR